MSWVDAWQTSLQNTYSSVHSQWTDEYKPTPLVAETFKL